MESRQGTFLRTEAAVTGPSCWERPAVPRPCLQQLGALLRGMRGPVGRGAGRLADADPPEELCSLLMCRERGHPRASVLLEGCGL